MGIEDNVPGQTNVPKQESNSEGTRMELVGPKPVESTTEQGVTADVLVRKFYDLAEQIIGQCKNINVIADQLSDEGVKKMTELRGESVDLGRLVDSLKKSISEADASLDSPDGLKERMRELGINVDAFNQKLENAAENLKTKIAETQARAEEARAKNLIVRKRDPKSRGFIRGVPISDGGELRDPTTDEEALEEKYLVADLRNELLTYIRVVLSPLLKTFGKKL